MRPPAIGVVRCRPETTFRVTDGERTYVIKVPPTPYADADSVGVYPGDDFFVAADEKDGYLLNFRFVDPPREPRNVLHVLFVQDKMPNGTYQMKLTVQSFFARRLVYHALAHHPERPEREYVKTSTCPLGPMMRVIELWPTPISFLKLTDFKFSNGREVCAYY
jgi:hypothetical protein